MVGLVLASQAVRALVTALSFVASRLWVEGRLETGAALVGAGLSRGGCGFVGSATVENTACVTGMRESSEAFWASGVPPLMAPWFWVEPVVATSAGAMRSRQGKQTGK